MIKVLFVCHGNICRSTMAQSVMVWLCARRGVSERFLIESAATSREEIGNPPHYGTVRKLKEMGVPLVDHRAVQLTKSDYNCYDLLVGMDGANIRNMMRICGGDPDGKIRTLLSFAGIGREVADPWYTGDFDATWDDVLTGCNALLDSLM